MVQQLSMLRRFLAKLVHIPLFFVWLGYSVACAVVGHRWKIICTNMHRAAVRAGMHTMAGQDANCVRCGKHWRDAKVSEADLDAIRKYRLPSQPRE